MASLEELEASLRTSWDRDLLAVYADELQQRGELRGELIVIDLRIETDGPLPELVARRKELLAAWLATLPPGKVQHGFLDVDATGADPVGQVRAALASPAATYIRTVAIVGAPATVREALGLVAAAPRPGLARLVVRQWDHGDASTLGRTATKKLFDALPDLDTLELDGYRICGDVAHPTLRRLRISGFDAISSITGTGESADWAALVELDFAYASHIGGAREGHVYSPKARRFPALRTLDLSRNEPGYLDPINLGGSTDPYAAAVAGNPLLHHLHALRLPRPPTPQAAGSIRQMLASMPELEELAVRGGLPGFRHATARLSTID